MENRIANRGVNFRDFLVYRYANADLAQENDPCARLAVQLLNDERFNVDALGRYPNYLGRGRPTQYDVIRLYFSRHPEYVWCLADDGLALFTPEIELAWIEYDKWLSGLMAL